MCRENGLLHCHVFSSGLIGSSGLQIISRYPIKEVFFHRYRVNGKIYRFDHGDYHVGKGFGFAKIAISDTQNVSIIVTHTIARYNHEDDTYAADRLSQVWELIRFLQLTARGNQPFIVVGDMNSKPNSVEYSLFTQVGKLVDAYGEHAAKCETHGNFESITSMDENPQRIDYIFFSRNKNWSLRQSEVVFNDTNFLYSDHFGVSATFDFNFNAVRRKDSDASLVSVPSSPMRFSLDKEAGSSEFEPRSFQQEKDILQECSGIVLRGIDRAAKRKTSHFMRSIMFLMAVWLLLVFGAPLQVVVALVIVAMIEALVALFPVENEISALREVQNEIRYFF